MGETDMITLIAILAAASAIAGFLAGLLGIGGGIVMVPALYFAFGAIGVAAEYQMHLSVATALAVIVPTGAMSAWSHHKRGGVDRAIIRQWGVWIVSGAIAGSLIAAELESRSLVIFFGAMAGLMGLKMILPLDGRVIGQRLPQGPAGAPLPFLIGGFSSVMGIGGATFSVPVLTLFSVPLLRAVGTASLLGFLIALPSAFSYMISGHGVENLPPGSIGFVNLIAFATAAPVSMAMAPLGAKVAHAIPRRALSIVFGIALIVTSVRFLA